MSKISFDWIIPGKLAGHQAPAGVQDLTWLKTLGILALVRMAAKSEARVNGTQVLQNGLLDCFEPVPDFSVPAPVQINRMVGFIEKAIAEGKPVGVSCGAGLGRTGTVIAVYLVYQGLPPANAIKKVRTLRPGSIETKDQEETVFSFARQISAN